MNSPITGKPMQRVTRPSTMTIRGVAVPVAEYQVWRDDENNEEFEDEEMIDRNIAQAWAAYDDLNITIRP